MEDPVNVSDFDFDLPDELIAQTPPAERGGSRLLVLNRETGSMEHAAFAGIGSWLRPGDLLVLNNTRVFPARLLGHRAPSGGAVECLLLQRVPRSEEPEGGEARPGSMVWEALMHPGQKLKPGAQVVFEAPGVTVRGEVLGRHFHGRRTIRLWDEAGGDLDGAVDRLGHIPLPPYIKREDTAEDRDRYQTVYARERGSIAAPTAGLHFTSGLLADLRARGIETTEVTLHVGYGTFKPVRVERVEDHEVDPEPFTVTASAAGALTRAKREGRRVIAVGTTTARTLESLHLSDDGEVAPVTDVARLFIRPGHRFRTVDALVTNFHLPRSSLLMLVAALAGRERILAAYRDAVARGYHFYSYGDAMLIV
jgi:S-adenosylmethionine:tRNA ribosyltransferase-isomerase